MFYSVKIFFETSMLLPGYCYTNIVLIPKITNPTNPMQFSPISLCTFNYKIISKVLGNRLKILLPRLITPFQSALVSDEFIHDNILIAHEVFHHLRMNKKCGIKECAVELDMNKAYDRVELEFFIETLIKMDFLERCFKWIEECITNVQYNVVVNGDKMTRFRQTRGLR